MIVSRSILAAWVVLIGSVSGHGTHDERVRTYSAKVALDSSDLASRHALALAHVEGGAWQLALSELDAAENLRKPDSNLDFSVTRAKALVAGGKFTGARLVLDAFLEKSPADPQGLLERSGVFDALQMPAESLADFRRAMAVIESPEPSLCLEFADKLVGRNLADEASKVIQKAIAEKGEMTPLVLKALDLETATSQWELALTRIDFLENAAPRKEPWIGRRAILLTKAGRDSESHAAWRGLLARINALPNLERGTPAMLQLAEDARHALAL